MNYWLLIVICVIEPWKHICFKSSKIYHHLWSLESMEQLVNFIIRPPRYQFFQIP
jgi:hypothetical protein